MSSDKIQSVSEDELIKTFMNRNSGGILQVISRYVSLGKVGSKYVGLCPFHLEETPSFTVDDTAGVFHCFGCLLSGNVGNFSDLAKSRNVKPIGTR